MPMSVRLAAQEDRPAILELLRSAQEDAVPEAKRGEQGFVPGAWDEDALAAYVGGPGIFLVEDKNKLAGVALTSEGPAQDGPAQRTAELTAKLEEPVLHWGPVVVAPKYRGRGVVRLLLSGMSLMLGDRYPSAAVHVDNTNQRALKVHRALGMTKHGRFTLDDRTYTIFTFAPEAFSPKPAR